MKIEKNIIVSLLLGVFIGAVGMGLVDANRPKPMFSSADSGGGLGSMECKLARLAVQVEELGAIANNSSPDKKKMSELEKAADTACAEPNDAPAVEVQAQ